MRRINTTLKRQPDCSAKEYLKNRKELFRRIDFVAANKVVY